MLTPHISAKNTAYLSCPNLLCIPGKHKVPQKKIACSFMGIVPFSRWPLHNTSCVDALAVGPWRAGCAHATCAHATGRPLFSNCCACPAAQPHGQPAAKTMMPGMALLGGKRNRSEPRTLFCGGWDFVSIGFMHCLFLVATLKC